MIMLSGNWTSRLEVIYANDKSKWAYMVKGVEKTLKKVRAKMVTNECGKLRGISFLRFTEKDPKWFRLPTVLDRGGQEFNIDQIIIRFRSIEDCEYAADMYEWRERVIKSKNDRKCDHWPAETINDELWMIYLKKFTLFKKLIVHFLKFKSIIWKTKKKFYNNYFNILWSSQINFKIFYL